MLNKEGQRELAYVVKIDNILPIVGSDNCECAVVGGWIMERLDRIPDEGDSFVYENLTVTVIQVDEHRVESVRVVAEPKEETEE